MVVKEPPGKHQNPIAMHHGLIRITHCYTPSSMHTQVYTSTTTSLGQEYNCGVGTGKSELPLNSTA